MLKRKTKSYSGDWHRNSFTRNQWSDGFGLN